MMKNNNKIHHHYHHDDVDIDHNDNNNTTIRYVRGIPNYGQTCYMNATLQSLAAFPQTLSYDYISNLRHDLSSMRLTSSPSLPVSSWAVVPQPLPNNDDHHDDDYDDDDNNDDVKEESNTLLSRIMRMTISPFYDSLSLLQNQHDDDDKNFRHDNVTTSSVDTISSFQTNFVRDVHRILQQVNGKHDDDDDDDDDNRHNVSSSSSSWFSSTWYQHDPKKIDTRSIYRYLCHYYPTTFPSSSSSSYHHMMNQQHDAQELYHTMMDSFMNIQRTIQIQQHNQQNSMNRILSSLLHASTNHPTITSTATTSIAETTTFRNQEKNNPSKLPDLIKTTLYDSIMTETTSASTILESDSGGTSSSSNSSSNSSSSTNGSNDGYASSMMSSVGSSSSSSSSHHLPMMTLTNSVASIATTTSSSMMMTMSDPNIDQQQPQQQQTQELSHRHDVVTEQVEDTKGKDDMNNNINSEDGGHHRPLPSSSLSARMELPFCGWIGSKIQCTQCHRIRPIQNVPFLSIPIIPTSISSSSSLSPPPESLLLQSSCTLTECLQDFIRPERISMIQCRYCTIQLFVQYYHDEIWMMQGMISSYRNNKQKKKMPSTTSSSGSSSSTPHHRDDCSDNRSDDNDDDDPYYHDLIDRLYAFQTLYDVFRKMDPGDNNNDDHQSIEMIYHRTIAKIKKRQQKQKRRRNRKRNTNHSHITDHDDDDNDLSFRLLPPSLQQQQQQQHHHDHDQQQKLLIPLLRHDAYKSLSMTRFPSLLSIHIQRRYYHPTKHIMCKSLQHIQLDQYINMAPYCEYHNHQTTTSSNNHGAIWYRLMAVIEHKGNAHYGHYVCYRRHPTFYQYHHSTPPNVSSSSNASPMHYYYSNEQRHHHNDWLYISDDIVQSCTWDIVRQCQAYMLFYEKVS